ncbi:MAG: hypothetical protein WCH75_11895 [Candidatus Binatia bacterium]|jgi:hypothetical protein
MSRKQTSAFNSGLVTDGWISIEPTDLEIFESVYKKTVREGEERLMLAVLEEAIQCFQQYILGTRPREKRLFQEAEDWILEKDNDYIFSFEYICETLKLHPDHIRQGLMTWRDAKRKIDSLKPEANRRTKVLRTRYVGGSGRLAKTG